MKCPLGGLFPARLFTRAEFDYWVRTNRPDKIELTDNQYANLAEAMMCNPLNYDGIPIVFLDKPPL